MEARNERRSSEPGMGQICPDRMYSLAGLQLAARISPRRLREAINLGLLPSFTIGRLTYVKGAAVITWMEQHCQGGSRRALSHPLT